LQNYIANTTDGTFTSYTKSYKWVITPTNSVSFSNHNDTANWQGSNLSTFKWKNEPNSPQRKLKVTVKWVSGTDEITRTDEKVVTVKHIAPIASMTFTGAISTSVNSSGQTVPLPCTTNPLTITVPTPFTDPAQAVTYSWVVSPGGWTGSSPSNTITITPLIGGNGTVTVNAKRTNGTVIQSFTVFSISS
jgi:hypothetical protein